MLSFFHVYGFTSFSKHPFHSTFYTVFLHAVAFSALFAVFRDALAVIVACWHARVCSGGWDVVGGWGGVGGGGVVGGGWGGVGGGGS